MPSFLYTADGRGRWKNELSIEQRSITVDFSRHYLEQIVREMTRKKSVSFPRNSLSPVLRKQCSCNKLQGDMFKDKKMSLGLTRTVENYPMERTASDTRTMLDNLRQLISYKNKITEMQEDESKKLLEYNKQRFEALLEKKDNSGLPRTLTGISGKNLEQLPKFSINLGEEQQRRRTSKFADESDLERADPPVVHTELNHLRGQCKAQARVCRHIHKISSQYQVVCTATPETCEAQWKLGKVSAGSGFHLVPLEDDKTPNEPLIEEDETPSGHSEDQSIIEASTVTVITLVSAKSEAEDEVIEESEVHCWLDDATVSSIDDQKVSTAAGIEINIDTIEQPEVTIEPRDVAIESHFLKPKRESAMKTSLTVMKSTTSRYSGTPLDLGNAAKMKLLETPEENEADTTSQSQPAESEHEAEPEEEEEMEPSLPKLICPSSAAKSHDSEIKMWLKKSPFSAASKIMPFYT